MNNYICVRLKRGDDIKAALRDIAACEQLECGAVISAVGCVSQAVIRDASGVDLQYINEACEIVSLMGTVSKNRSHLHISLAKRDLSVIGGHLMEGCVVNTTCELIIVRVSGYSIQSEFDGTTGYDEAVFSINKNS